MKADKRKIFRAAADANRIAEWILSHHPEHAAGDDDQDTTAETQRTNASDEALAPDRGPQAPTTPKANRDDAAAAPRDRAHPKGLGPMKKSIDQMTLPLFDTTSLSTGAFGLYSGLSFGEPSEEDEPETEDQAPADASVAIPARNFRLRGRRPLASDWKSRAADNLAAIRLMQRIEGETRNATPEEQSQLARFISFGAGDLANNLFRRAADEALPKGWEALGQELEQLVRPTELASLARVTQYAHFTPEFIIRAMWKALRRMGFSECRVLEPGCGSGLFFSLLPEALADKTTLTGVELDPVTAKITKLLFPNAQIRNEDFTKARLPDAYDLVIGNPSFSTRTVRGSDPVGALNLSPTKFLSGGSSAPSCSNRMMTGNYSTAT
ncbi:hypothetical protein CH337_22460 [Rhodoblastus acidophilus]|nr:hypothetical protein CH337_22460 [Rhodoblastus acidophilus]